MHHLISTVSAAKVYDYHDQIIKLYQTLLGKINIPKIKELMEDLLTMEQNEFKNASPSKLPAWMISRTVLVSAG